MLYFLNDYSEGAHEKVLQHLIDTNMEQLPGYGTDHYCEEAKEKIKKACGCEDAEVFLLTGGTQTNQIVIDTMLQPYEGVVAAQTGHVSTHEAGAIEFTGHKVLTLPEKNGKINAADLKNLIETFYGDENHEHMVFPGMVYISHPTEYGTLYTKKELTELSAVCREYKIPLFMDGARLIYGLVSKETDVTLQDIAKLCDVFYIGGTKAGALCGEAVVFTGDSMPKHFLTRVKQHGALLAKGRLTGVQFDALFTDDLYLEIGKNAIETAAVLKAGLKEKGYTFYIDSPTNQQFVVLENRKMEELKKDKDYTMSFFSKKTASQWSEGTFECFYITNLDRGRLSNPTWTDSVKNLMVDGHSANRAVTTICNYFIVFLWLGIILFLIFDFRKLDAYKLIFAITFIGGFLFHLVWEAKGQYTIIYAYLMIPYMLRGYQLLLRRVCNISLGEKEAKEKRGTIIPVVVIALVVIVIGISNNKVVNTLIFIYN